MQIKIISLIGGEFLKDSIYDIKYSFYFLLISYLDKFFIRMPRRETA